MTKTNLIEPSPGMIVITDQNDGVWFVISFNKNVSYLAVFDRLTGTSCLERWGSMRGFIPYYHFIK
jgi:hypothetical protein